MKPQLRNTADGSSDGPMFKGGCFGTEVVTRPDAGPLVIMWVEDDETWHEKDFSFDAFWIDDIITQLKAAKREAERLSRSGKTKKG